MIAVEQSKETVTITEKEIRKYYQDALKIEPQMLINYLIKEIILFDSRADIYYNSPIKTTDSPDNSQGFSFYSKSVRLGHKLMTVTLFMTQPKKRFKALNLQADSFNRKASRKAVQS